MNQIEKRVHLQAPPSRVWAALTDHQEFSRWFGFRLLDPFVVGAQVRGELPADLPVDRIADQLREKRVEPVPMAVPPAGSVFCTVVRMEPERVFAFRWVPFGIEVGLPADAPRTLVEFTLTPAGGGTDLSIVESGFDQLLEPRRQRAFLMNTGGWNAQAENLRRYVDAG
jgi:uncharacterized protein YndB with AHSA1/START domain